MSVGQDGCLKIFKFEMEGYVVVVGGSIELSDILKHDMLRRGGDQEAADDEGCQSPVELSEVVWSLDPFLRVER